MGSPGGKPGAAQGATATQAQAPAERQGVWQVHATNGAARYDARHLAIYAVWRPAGGNSARWEQWWCGWRTSTNRRPIVGS